MHNSTLTFLGAAVLVVVVGVTVFIFNRPATTTPTTNNNQTATSTTGGNTTTPGNSTATSTAGVARIQLALLDTAGTTNGKARGCDRVVMTSYRIATTTAPLTAALETLFKQNDEKVGSWFNFMARTNDTLKFDRAEVRDGTAHIYLTGSVSGLAGVCDDPRAAIQIEETALQFATVQKVQLYLNGKATTSLVPSQQ